MNNASAAITDPQTVKTAYDTLHRYAGWLDRERQSVAVRNDVLAVGVAIEAGTDPELPLQALDADLKRLPNGEVRKMLRAASATFRRALDDRDRSPA
jgi:hypothetical protein